MRISIGISIVAAAAVAALALIAGTMLVDPPEPLVSYATLSPAAITPNADGTDDVTVFEYEVTEPSRVSMVFEGEDGTRYAFREDEYRDPGEYRVLFSGVVDGYTDEDESVPGEVLRRLMPNGTYQWTFTAQATNGDETMEKTGTLRVSEADSELPLMTEFSVSPNVFTPNQDGIDDRVQINVFVNKPHEELEVYLLNEAGERQPVARREEAREPGEAGRHTYDYAGGVDIGADPPPDGDYTVVARLRDAEGQLTQRTADLRIEDGGKPRAEIVSQNVGATVVFERRPYDPRFYTDDDTQGALIEPPDDPEDYNRLPVTMPVGDMLVFKLTVENYGAAPIRTTGPPPGTVYQQAQRAASLGAFEQSGAWRVGIDCETAEESYPWRWALGDADTLTVQEEPETGNTYLYLPSGERAVVWGAIRMTEYNEFADPMACWAGLIHEDVQITLQNNVVGQREIDLEPTDQGNRPDSEG